MVYFPDVSSPRVLKELLSMYGLQPHRRFGQNFLIDANIVRKITEAAGLSAGDRVVEVGPGAGALTVALARSGATLEAIEVDRGLVGMLKELFREWPGVTVRESDALKVCWKELIRSSSPTRGMKLVSNLPYNISAPFIYSLLREGFPFARAILMLQEEVALRLVGPHDTGSCGALPIICRYYTTGKRLFDVSPNVFWPRPRVGSTVIKLEPRVRLLEEAEETFFWKLVQGLFLQRRKTMANNMARLFDLPRVSLYGLLIRASVDPGARPEQLSVEQFANLARITYNDLSTLS